MSYLLCTYCDTRSPILGCFKNLSSLAFTLVVHQQPKKVIPVRVGPSANPTLLGVSSIKHGKARRSAIIAKPSTNSKLSFSPQNSNLAVTVTWLYPLTHTSYIRSVFVSWASSALIGIIPPGLSSPKKGTAMTEVRSVPLLSSKERSDMMDGIESRVSALRLRYCRTDRTWRSYTVIVFEQMHED